MKKICLKIMMMLAVALIGVCACASKDVTPDGTPENPPVEQEQDKSIKILAIGNSFSVDAMEYLYGILKDVGYEDITLGNLYIGGCTLETHANNFTNNSASYTYYTNTTGTWTNKTSFRPLDALDSNDWDIITMQQGSPKSGIPSSYDPYLLSLIHSVMSRCEDAELVWHMTWAYQANSTHSGFASYNKDQMTMYNAILDAVKTKVMSTGLFSKVIPNGTAVQNMRTSFVGDNLTRDGYHMSYDKGRYLTALTFAKALTDCDLDVVTYTPSAHSYTENEILAMKEAATNACKSPYEVTVSSYLPEVTDEPTLDLTTASTAEILEHYRYNPADYTVMQIEFTDFAYYNSSNSNYKSKMYTVENSGWNNTICDFVTTPIFTKEDLPDGTLIVQRSGNMYRPEGWITLDTVNSSSTRPGNVTANVTVVNDAWWGTWTSRAFNLAFADRTNLGPNPLENPTADNLCGKLKEGFAIYVPKK